MRLRQIVPRTPTGAHPDNKKPASIWTPVACKVGESGFEPLTSRTRTRTAKSPYQKPHGQPRQPLREVSDYPYGADQDSKTAHPSLTRTIPNFRAIPTNLLSVDAPSV